MNPSQGFILTGIFFAFRVCAPMLSDTPGYYNPQNEMLSFHKTKCSETQNEASSL